MKEISLVCQQEFSFGELNVVVVWCLVLLTVRDNITLQYGVIIGSHELGYFVLSDIIISL